MRNSQSINLRTYLQNQSQSAQQSGTDDEKDKDKLGSPEDEMLARNEIKYYEKLHRENVDRAREVADLSARLQAGFVENRNFGQTERKSLERLEKLIRRIRGAAGGSSGDDETSSLPHDVPAALEQLKKLSDALRMSVEKTPRMVVSAAVIERSNELLQILRYLRQTSR